MEQRFSRPLDPTADDGCRLLGRDFPIGLKATKVVNAHDIHLGKGHPEPISPPAIIILSHPIPAIERVSPSLPGLAKIVRRDTGDKGWLAVLFQEKEVRVGPDIGAIKGDKDGNITNDANPSLVSIRFEFKPLSEKEELLKFMKSYLVSQPL